MVRLSKKSSLQRSINGRKNIMKRFDKVNQVTRQGEEGCGGEEVEELQLVEILHSQSEIENALKLLRFIPEADKRLKYTTRPCGSEQSIRRFRSKFRNDLHDCDLAEDVGKTKIRKDTKLFSPQNIKFVHVEFFENYGRWG
ncbi:hypothetical protein V1506DRAFT_509505 [Lipomyces tetrasporus]